MEKINVRISESWITFNLDGHSRISYARFSTGSRIGWTVKAAWADFWHNLRYERWYYGVEF